MLFNDRRALRAAQGGSLAPLGYRSDKKGRKAVNKVAAEVATVIPEASRKDIYGVAMRRYEGLKENGLLKKKGK